MLVFPKPGLRVRDPAKRDVLPDDGRDVSAHDPYWRRRLADGDVTTAPPDSTRKHSPVPVPSKGATEP